MYEWNDTDSMKSADILYDLCFMYEWKNVDSMKMQIYSMLYVRVERYYSMKRADILYALSTSGKILIVWKVQIYSMLQDSFVCSIVLLTLWFFYEPAMTTTKLPLVGWLKFFEFNLIYVRVTVWR